jgi:hypothetical protein
MVQARDALILYYEQFRGIPLRKMPEPSEGAKHLAPPPSPKTTLAQTSLPKPALATSPQSEELDWRALKEAVIETLRVKNYALATERTEKEVSPYILTLLKKEVPYILTLLISVLYPVGLWRCGSG